MKKELDTSSNDNSEEMDGKDRAKEGSKEYHTIRDKACSYRRNNKNQVVFSTKCVTHILYIQQLKILQLLLLAYNKIPSDYTGEVHSQRDHHMSDWYHWGKVRVKFAQVCTSCVNTMA